MALQAQHSTHPAASPTSGRFSLRLAIEALAKRSPALLALIVFGLIITLITLLLLLPTSKEGVGGASFLEALFTATSAVCVTGLTIVNTAAYWTPFGQGVIALGMQIGGLGVMTLASLLGLAVSRHIGLTQRILTAAETKSRLGEVGGLLRAVVFTSISAEAILTLLYLPTMLSQGMSLLDAIGHSLFFAVSTFNNGGFVALDAGTEIFATSWGFSLPLILGTITGAIGFPAILNIAQNWRRPSHWSLHVKLTLVIYAGLFLVGTIMIAALEWTNPLTFANFTEGQKILGALVHSAAARSSGFSTVDIGSMRESTWWLLDGLMFIGGGSAGTAGGIKVTTFAVLVFAIVAEARGDRDVEAFGKRMGSGVVRLAISATLLGAVIVGSSTLILLQLTDFSLSQILFETVSAFGTCGLSTGITPLLPDSAKFILIVLMYLGRVGTMTFAAALALRHRRRVVRLPEERPIIG